MSTQAVTWAMDEAPMLLTKAGKPDTTARGVLIARAERADKHGRNSRAAIEDVMWRTGFDRSTVQRAERRLETAGLLIDAGLTHDGLTRWNLAMNLRRDPAEREKMMAAIAEKKAVHAAGERKRRANQGASADGREDFKSAREDSKFAREDFKSAREDSVLPEPSLNRQEPSMNHPRGSAPPEPPRAAPPTATQTEDNSSQSAQDQPLQGGRNQRPRTRDAPRSSSKCEHGLEHNLLRTCPLCRRGLTTTGDTP